MRKYLFFLSLVFVISACNNEGIEDKIDKAPKETINLNSNSLEMRLVGGPCIVKGECSSMTCNAMIECGCDETPKCECSWSICKCDCHKKGSALVVNPKHYSVDIYSEYFDNLNSLISLAQNSSNIEVQELELLVEDVFDAINNNDLEAYSSHATHLYDYVHSIENQSAIAEINVWFIERGISDEI